MKSNVNFYVQMTSGLLDELTNKQTNNAYVELKNYKETDYYKVFYTNYNRA